VGLSLQFGNAFILVIGGLLVAWSLYAAASSLRRARGYRKFVGFIGGILVAYGITAFCGLTLSAKGSLPASFEWPIGRADQLIDTPDGRRVAVHEASARIQVYDRDWKLLHAWVVHAGAGDFRAILLPEDNKLVVWTVRGVQRYVFTLDGTQVERTSYPLEQYARLPALAGPGDVPTPILLWPFSSRFAAWSVAIAGALLLVLSDSKRILKRWRKRDLTDR
jgi:hypothetical protein